MMLIQNVNKYECTIDQEMAEHCCIGAGQTLRVHSPVGSIFLRDMTSWPPD